ncbi:pinopsin-like [Conger conger]|uniref:pinopsin-like n=1 Tax=Conger conger TaxID=82655 RepID=UPI002A5AF7B7|nr:pinopsin-like [Conger conger]
MVVQRLNLNFSTSDSSVLNLSENVSLRDPLVPQDTSSLSRTGHTVVAVFLGFILILGFLSNFVVLIVFARFRALRTPINLILLNISVSDMLVCIFGTPFSFAASLYGSWLIGHHGCKWYGFANALFGIVSLVSLAILSYERYTTVLCPTKADVSDFRKAWLSIGGSWLYSLVWTVPPLLGWSGYGPEGPGTTCSVQWQHPSANSISYVVCLFVFCLLLPLLLMIFCYGKILLVIRGVAKINQTSAQRRENHILLMVVFMVSCYLLCWMPYGVVSMIASFGKKGLISPTASIVPSVLAKSSTVVNPIIYMLFNNQFYRCFVALVKCGADPDLSHTLNTQPSSRGEEHLAKSIPLSLLRADMTPSHPGTPYGTQIGAMQRENCSLVLVAHYSPSRVGQLVQ